MLRVVLFLCSVGFLTSMAAVTFTNLKCTYFNETFGEFKECRIKAVNRTHKYIVIYSVVNLKPVNNVTVNFKLLRNNNGYKPFFIDITGDGCRYLKYQNNAIANLLYATFRDHSNLNHTCPYDHDIIVDKLWTGNQDANFAKYLPIPNGDYIISLTFNVYNFKTCRVELYVRKTS